MSAKVFNASADPLQALGRAKSKLERTNALHFHYTQKYAGLGPYWKERLRGLPDAVATTCPADLSWLTNEEHSRRRRSY